MGRRKDNEKEPCCAYDHELTDTRIDEIANEIREDFGDFLGRSVQVQYCKGIQTVYADRFKIVAAPFSEFFYILSTGKPKMRKVVKRENLLNQLNNLISGTN